MKIDKMKWNAQRLDVETRIRDLKRSIRHGGAREDSVWNSEARKYEMKLVVFGPGLGTYRDHALLLNLKNQATVLYGIRAQFRGRKHTPEFEVDEKQMQEYALQDVAVVVLAEVTDPLLGVG